MIGNGTERCSWSLIGVDRRSQIVVHQNENWVWYQTTGIFGTVYQLGGSSDCQFFVDCWVTGIYDQGSSEIVVQVADCADWKHHCVAPVNH